MEVDEGSQPLEAGMAHEYLDDTIPVPAAQGSRLHFSWGLSGAQLRVIGVTSNEPASTSGAEHVQPPVITRVTL